jgi:hypothetical protein
MFIATLSLCTSIFNGYINTKFLDFIQRNTGRVEYLRTCKEIIDAYFQVKVRVGVINANAARQGASSAEGRAMTGDDVNGASAVNKFAALGTYLANLRDDAARKQYTDLTVELEKIIASAKRTPAAELNGLFGNADQMFATLNDDCVKSAKDAM